VSATPRRGVGEETTVVDEMTPEQKRRDQLLAAPNATEEDAAPRVDVSRHESEDGPVTRIDVRDDAVVRPGDPGGEPDEG
jgi:hypothetical protein